jgi:hypothetical protein
MNEPHLRFSRRDFLRTVGRWLAGGLLAGGAGWLLRRGGPECLFQSACGICPDLSRCRLPQAADLRSQIAKDS